MSRVSGQQFREMIAADVQAAWTVDKVHFGRPRIEKDQSPALPYAVVRLASVPAEWGSVACVEQTYRFEVMGRFPWPVSGEIEEIKENRANDLIERLMAAGVAGDGYLPMVEDVRFSEEADDESDPWYEVTIIWTVRRQVIAVLGD